MMAFDTAGCEMPRRFAALPMLPASITVIRISRSRSLMRRLIRSFQGIGNRPFQEVMARCYNNIIEEAPGKIASPRQLDVETSQSLTSRRAANQRGNTMDRRVFLTGAAALGFGVPAFRGASAQSFPSNVIRIVVPSSASTPPDILARVIANA